MLLVKYTQVIKMGEYFSCVPIKKEQSFPRLDQFVSSLQSHWKALQQERKMVQLEKIRSFLSLFSQSPPLSPTRKLHTHKLSRLSKALCYDILIICGISNHIGSSDMIEQFCIPLMYKTALRTIQPQVITLQILRQCRADIISSFAPLQQPIQRLSLFCSVCRQAVAARMDP